MDVRRKPGGGGAAADPLALVLRMEAGGAFAGTPISIRREATVYAALADTAVPAPRLVALSDDASAMLLERVSGDSDFWSLEEAERERTFADFVEALSALHGLDVSHLPLEGFERPATAEDHARLDLSLWHRLAREHVPDLDPLAVYAGAWLLAHPPVSVARTVLVHGDIGPGNFMAEGGRVTGLLDWEFAHLGDPMDDIAWLEMRSGIRPGAEIDLGERLRPYTRATGIEIDPARVDYYRVAVYYRCAVTAALAVSRGGGARGWFPYLLALQRFYAGLADALARVTGVAPDAVELPDADATPRTAWYDEAIAGLRAGVRGIADVELREQTRNLQIALHYLRAYDRLGPRLEELEAADRVASLGIAPEDTEAFGKAVEGSGAAGDEAMLGYLMRRTQRQRALWRTLLDRPRRR